MGSSVGGGGGFVSEVRCSLLYKMLWEPEETLDVMFWGVRDTFGIIGKEGGEGKGGFGEDVLREIEG